MKTLLSILLVLIIASMVSAQPPRGGKFGIGEGQFGDPAKMAEMRENMRQRWQNEKPNMERQPGPPPWAGRGMRMGGPRGPQNPFLDRCSQSPTNLRGRNSKNKVSSNYFNRRGQGWQFKNNNCPYKRNRTQKQEFRGYNPNVKVIIIR